MTTSLETLEQTLTRIELLSQEIMQRMVISGQQVVVIGGLSDISEDLGLIKAGELRVGRGTPNVATDTFTGVRIGSPGWLYGTKRYAIVGVNDDVLQFGLSTEDGRIYAGAGRVVLDNDGITLDGASINGSIKFKYSGASIARVQSTSSSLAIIGRYPVLIGQPPTAYGEAATGITVERSITSPTGPIMAEANLIINDAGGYFKLTSVEMRIVDDGIYLGRDADPGVGNVAYTGALKSYKNSTEYTGYAYVPLPMRLASIAWDGESFSTTAKTLLDLSSVFGAPAGVKAVDVQVSVRDSASATNDCYLVLGADNLPGYGRYFDCSGIANDAWKRYQGIIPCDANGDVYYQVVASGASTLDIILEIHGYFI